MLLRSALALLLLAWPLACFAEAIDPNEGLGEYVRALAHRGNSAELDAMVGSLEGLVLPDCAGRRDMVATLRAALIRESRTDLVRRLDALPQPVRPAVTPRPAPALVFPRDHGAHPSSFVEWWYFNGHLRVAGKRLGYMVTFFKTMPRIHFAHLAVVDLSTGAHPFTRHYMRPSQVSASSSKMDVTFGDDKVTEIAPDVFRLEFTVEGRRFTLDLTPTKAPMIVNGDGVIDMPEGLTSRYYSQTRLDTKGFVVDRSGVKQAVTGQSWFDHQWGQFIALFRPWDWFCFQMDDGSEYNIFHFRKALGSAGRSCVNKVDVRGRLAVSTQLDLDRAAWWKSPRSGDHFVTQWRLNIPGLGESATVSTSVTDQEMPRLGWKDIPPAYWEGTIDILVRRADGTAIHGIGYGEHFPYRRPLLDQAVESTLPDRQ